MTVSERVEKTAKALWDYGQRHQLRIAWCNVEGHRSEYLELARWHLRHGGRAPGDKPEQAIRVSCETCAFSGTPLKCLTCWRKTIHNDNWRPKKARA